MTQKNLITLIAWRYIKGSNKEKNLSVMVAVCFCAILIGSCALTLVSCIMNGFEKATHEKLRGIHSQIIMRTPQGALHFNRIEEVIKKEFPSVSAISPVGFKHALIHAPDAQDTTTMVIIKGIDPDREKKIQTIAQKIIHANNTQKFELEDLLDQNKIIIGKKLADAHRLKLGDSLAIWSTDTDNLTEEINFNKTTMSIAAFFDTGIEEFDTSVIICSLTALSELFNEGISQINVNLTAGSDESSTIAELKKRFGLETYSWKELYPALVSALKLEKYAMFFVLMLITLVASMNIVSLLFMYIMQKRRDIAILKACGATQRTINSIFMVMGVGISVAASATGLLLAYIICLILKWYPFISLPDTYYVSYLPVSIEYKTFSLVFVVIILISSLASFFSIQKSRTLLVSSMLKGEE